MLDPIYLSPTLMARQEAQKVKHYANRQAATPEELRAAAVASMAWADSLTREQRAVLHEYGAYRTRRWIEGLAPHPSLQLISLALQIQLEEGLF